MDVDRFAPSAQHHSAVIMWWTAWRQVSRSIALQQRTSDGVAAAEVGNQKLAHQKCRNLCCLGEATLDGAKRRDWRCLSSFTCSGGEVIASSTHEQIESLRYRASTNRTFHKPLNQAGQCYYTI